MQEHSLISKEIFMLVSPKMLMMENFTLTNLSDRTINHGSDSLWDPRLLSGHSISCHLITSTLLQQCNC